MPAARIPGPSLFQFLGRLGVLRRDRVAFFWELWKEYGPIVHIPLPGRPLVVISDADHVQHVLVTNNKNYRKSPAFNVERQAVVGDSVLTLEGEAWTRARRLVQPAFRRAELQA